MRPVIVWFENDLRLADHGALAAAAASGAPVIPLFVWDGGKGWAEGAASRWWLHHSLTAFRDALAWSGLSLVVRQGDPADVVPVLARETDAESVAWLERPDPTRSKRDDRITERLTQDGRQVGRYGGALLHDPERVQTGSGGPYKVFTPFHNRFRQMVEVAQPLDAPVFSPGQATPDLVTQAVGELGLLPTIRWDDGLAAAWAPGERGALVQMQDLELSGYAEQRDIPSVDGTSRLSPHLHFGEVSPRQVWHAAGPIAPYRRQLVWRDFAHHLLHHFPKTREAPLRKEFRDFPWLQDADALRRWQRGQTGYPIVDAGMRQLWETGWMHNRVRMVVASFLTKHLLHSWLDGQAWFNDTLVDADLASNVFGWQWAGGCGADAQPFFRIFNPMTQGKKFDSQGIYVRRWIPEIAHLPSKVIHEPWTADVIPGDYPSPMVDHKTARERALAAYKKPRT
ncbi:MAG: deoxyribodipyrimidine photo-lyase [Rhodothermales bacterium]|jgi:deoxyribodipyrimidine photo-lyase